MDYEKAYKDALERAKGMWEQGMMPERIEYIFPELKESEDERIRENIIRVFKGELNYTSKEDANKYIAWLEKQGEQEPIDKVESKFKVGDWVVNNDGSPFSCGENTLQITHIDGEEIWFESKTWTTDKSIRLWTIADAKDGDVLKEDSCMFIIAKMIYEGKAIVYCCLFDDGDFDLVGSTLCFDVDSTHPATKEQRDFLFQKMHEAGYEWDSEKKELKKIENEIEIPFGAKDSELQEVTYYIPIGFWSHCYLDAYTNNFHAKQQNLTNVQNIRKQRQAHTNHWSDKQR